MRVVLIGECMVEMAPAAQQESFQLSFAGDTFNTAWYLRKLRPNWRVDYVTQVGTDAISDQMVSFMQDHGIGTDHIGRNRDRTVGLYLISLRAGERSFSYWRGQSAARKLAGDAAALDAALLGADLVYISGITLGILDPEGRALLLDRLGACGARIAFDTNLRPALWPDPETMCAAMMQAAAISHIVLPSHDDEARYFGDTNPQATLQRYLGAGAGAVVVKNGPGEILFAEDGRHGSVRPEPVRAVIDTTAAGDSFNAAVLAGFAQGEPLAPHIARASRLAGRVICGRGALVEIRDFEKETPS